MNDKPYSDTPVEGSSDSFERVFYSNIDSSELVFHRDKQDRTITACQNEGGWLLQMDNEIPKEVSSGMFIPKEIYHRLIKGEGQLTVTIKEST